MTIHPILASILSDLFVNLAAGWFGVVVIITPAVKRPLKNKIFVLTTNLLLAIVALLIAFWLKKNNSI